MPVDTREKRAATAGIHIQVMAGPGVTNAVAKDNEWRKEVGYAYPIVAAAVTTTAARLPLMGVGH